MVVSSCIVLSVVCFSVCFKLATCLDSLPCDATTRSIIKERLTLIFRILFLYFGQVLQLDSFTLEDGSFHVLDHLFLLLAQLVVPQLHAVDLLAHRDYFGLADLGVEGVLHLFFKLDFSFPEKDLSLSLDNLRQNFGLLFFFLRDLVFKFD